MSLPWCPRASSAVQLLVHHLLWQIQPLLSGRGGHTARGAGDTVAPRAVWAAPRHPRRARGAGGLGTPGSPRAALQKPWQVCATLKLCRGESGTAPAAPILEGPGTHLQVRGHGDSGAARGHGHAVSPVAAAVSPSHRAPAGPGCLRRRCRCRCRCAGCAARWWRGLRPPSPWARWPRRWPGCAGRCRCRWPGRASAWPSATRPWRSRGCWAAWAPACSAAYSSPVAVGTTGTSRTWGRCHRPGCGRPSWCGWRSVSVRR